MDIQTATAEAPTGPTAADAATASTASAAPPPATLYERLGRFEGLTRIVDDVMKAHLANPLLRTRFENSKDLDHAARMAVEFFCAGCGGPESYTGRDLVTAHKGMNISEQEYMAAMDDIVEALQKNGIDDATRNEVVAVLYSLKGQVIRV